MKRANPQSRQATILYASLTAIALFLPISLTAKAQRFDLAVTYTTQRALRASVGQNFWMQGGSVEFGVDLWHGWGLAADVTGAHASSIGSSGIPLSLVTETFGPRYRWSSSHKYSLYGQGLIGGANGFQSLFPGQTGSSSSAKSLAVQLGGGNNLRVGAGATIHF